ncbi:MAG: hypothetical protein M3Q75_01020, partial [Gemmatimonadota bacterium]|nr:hypothetical protein [Gemmatimonadota bacterium]
MRIETTTRELYRFAELDERAQQRAIEHVAERETQWVEMDDIEVVIQESVVRALTGVEGEGEPMPADLAIRGWDLDRAWSLDIRGRIDRDSAPSFPWPAGVTGAY